MPAYNDTDTKDYGGICIDKCPSETVVTTNNSCLKTCNVEAPYNVSGYCSNTCTMFDDTVIPKRCLLENETCVFASLTET